MPVIIIQTCRANPSEPEQSLFAEKFPTKAVKVPEHLVGGRCLLTALWKRCLTLLSALNHYATQDGGARNAWKFMCNIHGINPGEKWSSEKRAARMSMVLNVSWDFMFCLGLFHKCTLCILTSACLLGTLWLYEIMKFHRQTFSTIHLHLHLLYLIQQSGWD